MPSRLDRYKQRKNIRNSFKDKSHLKELSNSDSVKKILAKRVDTDFIDSALDNNRPIYNLEVLESEVIESLALLDTQFSKDKYDSFFESSKEVLIDQPLSPLKLSRSYLEGLDKSFEYNRNDYTKSPKQVGGYGISFDTQKKQSKKEATTSDGKIKDVNTGKFHEASEMDLDHNKPLKAFHDEGGFILSDAEKRQFGSDPDNHDFTQNTGGENLKLASKLKSEEAVGTAAGVIGSSENYADNVILGASRGHGFAAEKANHLYDVFTGKDAKIVGGDNAKNGADRLVDGVNIQTKYCNSGSKCISECFKEGTFRYLNNDGTPMQIEVPSDKYDSAVQAMENRIKKGQVPGVTDPELAKDIVKKGIFTYEQVRNIAKFGTIESLTYDAVNGIKLAGTAMGISAAVSFAVSLWNGEDWEKAMESSCYVGLKVGGVAWVSSIITAQLGRTGIEQGLRGATDWVVQQMGSKAAAWIANGLRSGNAIYGAAAMNHVSKLLRGNIVTGVVTTLVISSVDFVRMFQGRCSGAQLFKNVASTASGVAGGTGGWMAGAAGGAALGSAIPVIGTAAGGIIGGLLGAFAGGAAVNAAASAILDKFIEDDAKEMLGIIEEVFGKLAFDYLLNKEEAETVIGKFKSNDVPDFLRDMYASSDRQRFARKEFESVIRDIAENRKVISLPTDKQLIHKAGEVIEELAVA